MSYWRGLAEGYSRRVESASKAVSDAQEVLQEVLRLEYPLGAVVRVVHHRGSFFGRVVGWDYFGSRVKVENERSGKTSKWWAAHVELEDATTPDAGAREG